MDLHLPIMNGRVATRVIRLLPGMAAVPDLAITANAGNEARDACLPSAMSVHARKPLQAAVGVCI